MTEPGVPTEDLPPVPDDDWGRGLAQRGFAHRLLWVRPAHLAERHPRIEILDADRALGELGHWLADVWSRSFLESVHDRAFGYSFADDPDHRWIASAQRLHDAFARGELVLHVDRLDGAAPGVRPSPGEPPRPPGQRPPQTAPTVVATLVVHVRTPDGRPIAGASVRVAGPSSGSKLSDGGGTARFERVPPGRYAVDADRRGFVEGSASATVTAGGTTSVTVVLTPIELEIVDERDQVITGERVWIVGERVALTARTRPPGRDISAIRWIVPGQIVGGQVYTNARGTILPVPESAWTSRTMTFHWVASHAASRVQARAAVEGVPREASARFRVDGPTGVTLTSTTSSVTLGPDLEGHFSLKFHVNALPNADRDDLGTPGIRWEASYRTPASVSGQFAWLQLIQTRRSHTGQGGRVGETHSRGAFWLDDSRDPAHVFYDQPLPIAAPGPVAVSEGDSPSNPIETGDVETRASDTFKLHAMYHPGTAGAIWVTVAKLVWSWSGHAELASGQWRIVASDHLRDPVGTPSSELPEWSGSFQAERTRNW